MTKNNIKAAFGSAYLLENKICEMEAALLKKFDESAAESDTYGEHGKNYSVKAKKRSFMPIAAVLSTAAVIVICTVIGSSFGREKLPVSSGEATTEVTVEQGLPVADTTTEYKTEEAIVPIDEITAEPPEQTEEAVLPEKGYYDDVFVETADNPSSGPTMTYDEVIGMISNPQGGGFNSLYLVEMVKPLTLSECTQLAGWEEWFESTYAVSYDDATVEAEGTTESDSNGGYYGEKTICEVKVLKDLISGEELFDTMYVALSMCNPQQQHAGNPIYAPHERFTVAVLLKQDGSDITKACGGFMLQYDVVSENGVQMAYSRDNSEIDELHLNNAVDISETIVTSTTKNPAVYTQKLPLNDLVKFLYADWADKGVSRHFAEDQNPNTDGIGEAYIATYEQRTELFTKQLSVSGEEYDCAVYMYHTYSHNASGELFDESVISGNIAIDLIKYGEQLDRKMLYPIGQVGHTLDRSNPEELCEVLSLDRDVLMFSYNGKAQFLTVTDNGELAWLTRNGDGSVTARMVEAVGEYTVTENGVAYDNGITLTFDFMSMRIADNDDIGTEITVNPDLISELGMTFDELCEKYGEPVEAVENFAAFKDGYGNYLWMTNESLNVQDLSQAGGCNRIEWVDLKAFFPNLTYPITLDELMEKSGFTAITVDENRTQGGYYWSLLCHSQYENISINIGTAEHGIIDENAVLIISYYEDGFQIHLPMEHIPVPTSFTEDEE